jgi:alkylhydroperoxidase/carboxymuconolactone decarboxylase family protein YurZ
MAPREGKVREEVERISDVDTTTEAGEEIQMDKRDRQMAERFLLANPEWAEEARQMARKLLEDEGAPPEEIEELIEELALMVVDEVVATLRAMSEELFPEEEIQRLLREEAHRALEASGGEAVACDDVASAASQRMVRELGERFPNFPHPR